MDKELELTIQYHKIKLLPKFFLLVPEKAVIGNRMTINDSEIFITEDGVQLEAADDVSAIEDEDVTYLFDQADSIVEEMQIFEENLDYELNENDLEEIQKLYYDSFNTDIGALEIDGKNITIIYYPKEQLISFFQDIKESTETFLEEHSNELYTAQNNQDTEHSFLSSISSSTNSTHSSCDRKKIDVQELEDYVNERIIGHHDQIEDIVTTLAMNYQAENAKEIERILVAGPTGVGKTETFEVISEYLQVPFVNYATTTLSDTGFVGNDVDDILKYVFHKANGDMEKLKRAIVVLDEIDKLAIRGNDVSQESVQQNLLKLLEGHTFAIKFNEFSTRNIDTSFMSFIGCGAFPTIFEPKKQIGIHKKQEENPQVTIQSFLEFGMIPEFMGRFGQIEIFQPLTEFDRYLVLTKSKISPFIIKQAQFSRQFGIDLKAEESYYQAILSQSSNSSIGLRGLKNTVNRSLLKLENQLLKQPGVYKEAFVSKETVENGRQYILK